MKMPSGRTMPSRPPGFSSDRQRSMKRISVLSLADAPRGVHLPVLGLAVVVGHEEAGVLVLRVVGALRVILERNIDVVGLALDHNQGVLLILLSLGRAPDQKVGAGMP